MENKDGEDEAKGSDVASVASASGIDFSSIQFGGGGAESVRSETSHASTVGRRETMSGTPTAAADVQVAQGSAPSAAPFARGDEEGSDQLGGEADAILEQLRGSIDDDEASGRRRKVSAPRAGASERDWSVSAEPEAEPPPETEDGSLISLDPGGPPVGPWVEITEDEWTRLTTNDKERVEKLAREMQDMESAADWFAWFDLTHESPAGALKKAYFKMARRYHPDALGDEPEVFSRVATSLFAKVSEAYEVLSDDEAREKYINKHILGLKDEDDLAMEKVQQVLAAEAAFKAGMTVLNNGKVTEALQHFKKAVDGYPDEAEYVAYYGYTLFRANQNSNSSRATEGLDLIKKATELKEMAPKPYHLLGKCYLMQGDSKAARQWLRKSLKLQPDNPEAVRDYRRADAMSKGEVSAPASVSDSEESPKGGLSGFFGRFRKEKKVADAPVKPNPTSLDDFDFSQFDD